jgi:DNA sulfur modification protein DndD
MIINKITINNFGVFRGLHIFDLKPKLKESKPVILFGGLNGSGKTTLFEGIKTCIYGQLFSNEFRTKGEYFKYIKKRVLPLNGKPKFYSGSIELEIQFNDFGEQSVYQINRTWKINKNNEIEEIFSVLKNGKKLGEIEREHSQSFISNLIPLGVLDLFFFDGEKIQELAEDNQANDSFKSALDSVLGLDVIQTLVKDLKIYKRYLPGIQEKDQIIKEINEKEKRRIEIEENLQHKYQTRASLNTKFERLKIEIIKKENELKLQGAGYAKKRDENRAHLKEIELEINSIQNKLVNHYLDLFPFTLIPNLCIQLRNEINEEKETYSKITAINVIKKNQDNIKKQIKENKSLNLNQDSLDELFNILQNSFKLSTKKDYKFINNFSDKKLNEFLYLTEHITEKIPQEISNLSDKYTELQKERSHYENLLRRVPEDSILNPIINQLNELYKEQGSTENALLKIDEEIKTLNYKLSENERILKNLDAKIEQQNKNKRKIDLLRKIRLMLSDYQDIIRKDKLDQLKIEFLESMSMILRKPNFISDIEINQENFDIKLKRNGNFLDKSVLSNGEKQIYAVSMIHALAKVSGRPLPFVIDTPLARLDSEHRDSIVENFFPKASHQVIIFSTDTEVDKRYFEKLSPYISKVYHLEFNVNELSSEVTEGYFWTTQEVIAN